MGGGGGGGGVHKTVKTIDFAFKSLSCLVLFCFVFLLRSSDKN